MPIYLISDADERWSHTPESQNRGFPLLRLYSQEEHVKASLIQRDNPRFVSVETQTNFESFPVESKADYGTTETNIDVRMQTTHPSATNSF